MTAGCRATIRFVVVALAVVAGLAVAAPAAAAPTADCGDGPDGGALYTTGAGLEIIDDAEARPAGGPFVNRTTFRVGNLTVSADDRAALHVETASGPTACVAGLDATSSPVRLAVDGASPIVVDGQADTLAVGATAFDRESTGSDLAYAADESLRVRWVATGLSSGTRVQAVATDSGTVLTDGTVDDDGAVALTLPSGQAAVDVTVAPPSTPTRTPANETTPRSANQSTRRPPAPTLDVTPQALHFGNLTADDTGTRSVTVSNPASSETGVRVDATRVAGRDASAFTVTNGAPFTLAPGEQRDLDIEYTPASNDSEQASIQAQVQLRSNVTDAQVDVWLSTTQMVVDVRAVSPDVETDATADTVRIEAVNVPEGEELVVDTSSPRLQSRPAHVSRIETTYRERGNVTLEVTHSDDPVGEDGATYESSDRDALQYLSIAHSVPESAFAETGFRVRVTKSQLPAGGSPEEVSVARFADGTWNEQTVTLAEETADHYVYEVDANGFSQFVVTAPAVSVTQRGLVGPGLLGVLLVAGFVVFVLGFVLYRRRTERADASASDPDDDTSVEDRATTDGASGEEGATDDDASSQSGTRGR